MPLESMEFWAEGIDDNERARRMIKGQKAVSNSQQERYRRDRDIDNVRLYESNPVVTLYQFAGSYFADGAAMPLTPPDDSTNNKAKAAIDTLLAQVATTDQRPRFCVNDGSWRQRRRARELQNFTDGLVLDLKLHAHRKRAAKDAAILESGVGFLQFYREGNRCACQRVLATELTIDPTDGMIDGQWQTIWRVRPIAREKVIKDFGDGPDGPKTQLLRSQGLRSIATAGAPADNIEVFEAWHLPTSEDAEDGYHIIAVDIDGGDLLVKKYTKMYHELVPFAFEERFTTGWGLSLMTQARKLQRRINANSYRVDRAQKLFHAGHIYVDRTAQMDKSKFSNEIGTVWEGNGPTPPSQILFQAVAKEMYDQIERDGERIFENLGINQGASEGDTSRGLGSSAAAMREETKKSDQRNAERQQRWEAFLIACIKVALGVVRDIVTHHENGDKRGKGGGYKVAVPGKRGMTESDWKDVAIDEKEYVIEIKPASPVPTDPAGLVAFGEHMIELGAWTPDKLAGYMQDLDADGRTNRTMAQERRLEKTFEALLYDTQAAALPDEFTNLGLALQIGTEYLAQGEEDEVPQKHLERIRRYLKRCKKLTPPPPVPTSAPAQAAA